MNEEEKALETLKEVASDDFDTLGDDISPKMAQNILNVIDKQQKRIEKLTTTLFHYEDTLEHYEYKVFNGDVIDLEKVKELDKIGILGKEYISKDKIREVLKDLEEVDEFFYNASALKEAIKNSLKELLEE